MSSAHLSALDAAAPRVLWLDDPDAPDPLPALTGTEDADLAVVGGGYSGLWTALRAKQRHRDQDVVLLEATRCGDAASGRNGGFCSASLTHGFDNGLARWPEELAELDRLGAENLDGIERTVRAHDIDCDWQRTGELTVAVAAHQVRELAQRAQQMQAAGHDVGLLDQDAVRRRLDSPTYLAALWEPDGTALVEPARLAWGLRAACLDAGVRIYEHSSVAAMAPTGTGVTLRTRHGQVRADRVAIGTNAYRPLLRRLRLLTVPVYDHVLATEPLSAEQLGTLGWTGREGVADASNLFHYYRLTRDDRIVWGGYEPVYHFRSRIHPALEQRRSTHETLARHFFETFPQLAGVQFTHRWGGVIDTSTRFTAFFGTAFAGRVAYVLGYTGLGVAATRFGADVMLDQLWGERTDRTGLQMVRKRPLPFPPEPLRYAGVQLTRWSSARADARGGRRNLWLRTLDRCGLGFDF